MQQRQSQLFYGIKLPRNRPRHHRDPEPGRRSTGAQCRICSRYHKLSIIIEVEEILNGYSHWINCWYYKKSPQGYKPWG